MNKIKRDKSSGAILNCDGQGWAAAKARRDRMMVNNIRINKLEDELSSIKKLLEELTKKANV